MLRYLLGIITALILVAGLLIWVGPPETTPTGDLTADPVTDGAPAAEEPADAKPAGGEEPAAETDTGAAGTSEAFTSDPADGPPPSNTLGEETRLHQDPVAGFAIDLPAGWRSASLDEYENHLLVTLEVPNRDLARQAAQNMVLAAFRDWPADGITPTVSVHFVKTQEQDTLKALQLMIEVARSSLADVSIETPPSIAALGGLEGAVARLKETAINDAADVTVETTYWVLRRPDGFLIVQTRAPTIDRPTNQTIEAIVATFRRLD